MRHTEDNTAEVLDDLFPFGDAPDSPINEEEVAEAQKRAAIRELQDAFSGSFFDICSLQWPDKYIDKTPAARFVHDMHCKDFDTLNDGVKILLYRACMQLYRDKASFMDFPYPFQFGKDVLSATKSQATSKKRNTVAAGAIAVAMFVGCLIGIALSGHGGNHLAPHARVYAIPPALKQPLTMSVPHNDFSSRRTMP